MRCSMDSAFSFYCQEINQKHRKSKQTRKQKIKIKRFICQNHVTIDCAQFQKVMAPSQGGQPEEVNFSRSSQNKLPVSQRIWTPRSKSASRNGPPGPNPLADMDPPGPNPLVDLDPSPRIWTPQQN